MDQVFAPAPESKTELGGYRILSSTAGIRVSPLQLGAMSIGTAWSDLMGSMDKEQSFKLLDYFFDASGNFIDTANAYQDDESEVWLGEWMATRQNRDQMVIATKYITDYKSYAFGKGWISNFCGNSRRSMYMSVRELLQKLQTDWIDILHVHWWDFTTSIKEIMDSLHVLVEQGKVLYLGVSDTPSWIKALEERMAKGEILRGTYSNGQSEDERKISEALEKIASGHGTEFITAIALAYVRAKAIRVFPMTTFRALSIKLSQEQVEYLESVKPFEVGFPNNFIGPDPHVTA
ncbi:Conserved hypothetical protein [Trichoderma atroviride IMI 206040]|uniref:NADP-dependent oxidoreductase domain-containing protein n=1 Tax=Hypocrea atroviridis (strain ATCC 20476 / IMI 206040) TaxID=452589 RepID=G9NHP4_HYPAI|nr:uncharacterized protein TRIATDRAFT_261193 [Trichoderma atroviride IMI 206040]EHK49779.1 Conserved hypothetical protein [Trichoderma atroviride IMI 206040]